MKALAINSWALLFCAQLNVVSKIMFFSPNLQWCTIICRVHLSTDLLFSKFHLHGLMVINIINTMESPVRPNNSWEMRCAVQSVSKENKYKPLKPLFAVSPSHFSASILHPSKAQISYFQVTGIIYCKNLFNITKSKWRHSGWMRKAVSLLLTSRLPCRQETMKWPSLTHPAPNNGLKNYPWKLSLEEKYNPQ